MREPGRELGHTSAPTPLVGSKNPAPRDASTPNIPMSRADRVLGLRARLQAGDYDVSSILVAECMIARALTGFRTDSRQPGSAAPAHGEDTPSEAA
jgi:hypothetical protein